MRILIVIAVLVFSGFVLSGQEKKHALTAGYTVALDFDDYGGYASNFDNGLGILNTFSYTHTFKKNHLNFTYTYFNNSLYDAFTSKLAVENEVYRKKYSLYTLGYSRTVISKKLFDVVPLIGLQYRDGSHSYVSLITSEEIDVKQMLLNDFGLNVGAKVQLKLPVGFFAQFDGSYTGYFFRREGNASFGGNTVPASGLFFGLHLGYQFQFKKLEDK